MIPRIDYSKPRGNKSNEVSLVVAGEVGCFSSVYRSVGLLTDNQRKVLERRLPTNHNILTLQ